MRGNAWVLGILLLCAARLHASGASKGLVPMGADFRLEPAVRLEILPQSGLGRVGAPSEVFLQGAAKGELPFLSLPLTEGRYRWFLRTEGKSPRLGKLLVL